MKCAPNEKVSREIPIKRNKFYSDNIIRLKVIYNNLVEYILIRLKVM